MTNCNAGCPAWRSAVEEDDVGDRVSGWGEIAFLAEGTQGNSSHAGRPDSCVAMTKLNQSPA